MEKRVKEDGILGSEAGITMSRKKARVRYDLDSGDIRNLTDEEIKAILRAADELIATGGRSMLAKILKGSKDKKLLEHELDQSPAYGECPNFLRLQYLRIQNCIQSLKGH